VSVLRVIGQLVVVTSLLALAALGCASTVAGAAGSKQVTSSAPPASAPRADQQAPDKIISVRISGGKVSGVPERVEVDRGSGVRIEVTSDRRDEVHVHGYDKTVELAPGKPGAVQFVANVPGVFEVETHESGLLLFQLVVR
jgi:hypothetical protein